MKKPSYPKNEMTSEKIGAEAAVLLRSKRASREMRAVAGSDLTQLPDHDEKDGEKRYLRLLVELLSQASQRKP